MDYSSALRILKPPATGTEVSNLTSAVGSLPSAYTQFLRSSDGAEVGMHDRDGDCLHLWSSKDIPPLNEAYQISRWCPTLLAIGSDGGDRAVGLDRRPVAEPDRWPVVRVGFGDLDPAEFVVLAPSFSAWIQKGFDLQPGG